MLTLPLAWIISHLSSVAILELLKQKSGMKSFRIKHLIINPNWKIIATGQFSQKCHSTIAPRMRSNLHSHLRLHRYQLLLVVFSQQLLNPMGRFPEKSLHPKRLKVDGPNMKKSRSKGCQLIDLSNPN